MKTRSVTFLCVGLTMALLVGAAAAYAQPAKPDKEGWISLFNGTDLSGWHIRMPTAENSWSVVDGVLSNKGHGVDLVTDEKFMDMELHVEFKYPRGSNSGVYLQGRYEIQISDSAGGEPKSSGCGGLYRKVTPKENAAKPADEWQSFDVKFWSAQLGPDGTKVKNARITVIHNDKLIIENAEIDGPTGGQLDKDDGKPGSLMLQGNHGAIDFRNIKWRPLKAAGGKAEGA